jgi:hypothetical protein
VQALEQQATITDAILPGQLGSQLFTGMHKCLGGTAPFEVGALGFIEAGRGDGETRYHMSLQFGTHIHEISRILAR